MSVIGSHSGIEVKGHVVASQEVNCGNTLSSPSWLLAQAVDPVQSTCDGVTKKYAGYRSYMLS